MAALERMRGEKTERRVGATIFAIVLGWLGIAGVVNAIAWPAVLNSDLMKSAPPDFVARFPRVLGSWRFSLLMLAYGLTAFRAAKAIWRVSPSAVGKYVWWAAVELLAMMASSATLPGETVLANVLIFAVMIALLASGWLFIRRLVNP